VSKKFFIFFTQKKFGLVAKFIALMKHSISPMIDESNSPAIIADVSKDMVTLHHQQHNMGQHYHMG
jgi:hypothetical protein